MGPRDHIVINYVNAFNSFDIDGMIANMDDHILFENISEDEVNMTISGIDNFREHAEDDAEYFSERTLAITSIQEDKDSITIAINFVGVLAIDLPDGFKKGDEFFYAGKHVFTFAGNKITKLTDIS